MTPQEEREARKEATDDLLGVKCTRCEGRGCSNCSKGWIRLPRFMIDRAASDAAIQRQQQRRRLISRLWVAIGFLLVTAIAFFIRWRAAG